MGFFKKFSSKDIILIALLGAMSFVISFLIGSWITVATGIPASSALVTGLVHAFFTILAGLLLKKWGTITLMWLIYGVLAIPTIMIAPPGVLKVSIVLIVGLVYDSVIRLFNYSKKSFYFAWIVYTIILTPLMIGYYVLMGLPGWEKFVSMYPILITAYVIEGMIGLTLGLYIYNRIKNKRFIRVFTS